MTKEMKKKEQKRYKNLQKKIINKKYIKNKISISVVAKNPQLYKINIERQKE